MKALLLFLFICVGCGSDEKIVAPSPAANEKTVAPSPAPAAKEVATQSVTAPQAVAQSTTPELTGLTVTPVAGSTDKLDVSWNAWTPRPSSYVVRWKTGSQSYVNTRQIQISFSGGTLATSAQITGLTADTEYDIQVTVIDVDLSPTVRARSETSATTNATTVEYVPWPGLVGSTNSVEGTTLVFRMRLYDRTSSTFVGAPPGGLTVNVTVSDATNGGDFLAPAHEGAHTLTFAEGASSATLSIPTVDDNQEEPGGQITFTVKAGVGYTLSTLVTATANMNDNDAVADLRLWVVDSSLTRGTNSSHLDIPESGGRQALSTTVWLIGEDGDPVTRSSDTGVVLAWGNIDLEPGDLTSGDEVLVTIPAGKSYVEKVLNITPNHDTEQEDPEGFTLVAELEEAGPDIYDIVTLYLVDDGWEKPIATIAAGTSPVVEGTDATFTVTLSRAVSTPLKVNFNIWWSQEGAFWDPNRTFVDAPRSVEIAANATTATITVPTYDDATAEPDGYVKVGLVDGRHYQLHQYRNSYKWAKVIVTDNDGEAAPPGEAPQGIGAAVLTGLTVSSVAGEPAQLAVVWEAVEGAATYSVRWKTGTDSYGDAEETTALRYTITGLSAGTTYTVNVAALDADNTLLAEAAASGDTAQRTSGAGSPTADATPAVSFVIYYDPDGGAASADRYNQAVALLKEAGISYSEVRGDVRAEVDRLAGVTNSTMPRFFLGDPTAADWTSQPGENNGGLRWLKKVAGLSDPAVSFVIYYDPDGGAAEVDRYDQAVALLKEAGISYSEVTGDVRAEVDRLAGVTNSIMPRFFLGDPTAADWTSQPGENNGGLRWLKEKVAELSDD